MSRCLFVVLLSEIVRESSSAVAQEWAVDVQFFAFLQTIPNQNWFRLVGVFAKFNLASWKVVVLNFVKFVFYFLLWISNYWVQKESFHKLNRSGSKLVEKVLNLFRTLGVH